MKNYRIMLRAKMYNTELEDKDDMKDEIETPLANLGYEGFHILIIEEIKNEA